MAIILTKSHPYNSITGNRFPIFPYAFILAVIDNQKHPLAGIIVHLASIKIER